VRQLQDVVGAAGRFHVAGLQIQEVYVR
jgi:hypothetical protein